MSDIEDLKRQGLSIQAISKLTGFDSKTIRKCLVKTERTPVYGLRPALPINLDAFKAYIEERLRGGRGERKVLLCELRARGAAGRSVHFEQVAQVSSSEAVTPTLLANYEVQ